MKNQLLKFGEVVKALSENEILTERGKPIDVQNFKKMVASGKVPFYVIGRGAVRYFDYRQVEQVFVPADIEADDEIEEDDFKQMMLDAQEAGMQFAQYVKAKEVYETYISKKLDNFIKQREHIPIDEIKAFLEVIIGELKAKLYNVPNQTKAKFNKLDQKIVDFNYTLIDKAFAELHRKSDNLEDKLSVH